MSERIAIYAGSFDPLTNGHLDVLKASLAVADLIYAAIGVHPGKTPLLDAETRRALLIETCGPVAKAAGTEIDCITFSDLVITAAQRAGATLLIRGLRDGTDLDYEMQMAGMNGTMAPELQTVFLPASPSVRTITATLVRQIAGMGGNIAPFVPAVVVPALRAKFPKHF